MAQYKNSQYNIVIDNDERNVILYNCFTGGVIQLEKDVYESIQRSAFMVDDIVYGKELLENGYIVNKELDEFQRVKIQIENVINDQAQEMVSYVIAPTLNCNLRCVYCFQKELRTDGTENMMTEATQDEIINYIIHSNEKNTHLKKLNINWFGGEPLLCFDRIVSFCRVIKKRLSEKNIRFSSSMITNGVLLDEEKVKILSSECNLERVQITVDGDVNTYCEKKKATPELYKRVLENIQKATYYVKTKVRVNADKRNYQELQKLISSLYEKDINKKNFSVHFAQLRDYESKCMDNTDYYNDLEYWLSKEKFYSQLGECGIKQEKNKLPSFSPIPFCGVSRGNNVVIDYIGNLYKCEHYLGDKTQIVGDVFDGFYYNDIYKKTRVLSTDRRCESCNIFPCCNYAQCIAMHSFAGDGKTCKCYADQLETIKLKVKKYLEEKT